jgi:hypothetical protein
MSKQILNEEFKRMQKLAGIIVENENNTLNPNMQKQFNMIVSALKRAKSEKDIDQVYTNLILLPKKLTKIFVEKLVNMGLANKEEEGKFSLSYDSEND